MMKSILFENNPITIYLIMTMAQIKLNLLIVFFLTLTLNRHGWFDKT